MKSILFALFAFSLSMGAQTLNLSVSPATLPPSGGTAVLTMTFTDASPTANIAGFQESLNVPPGVTVGAPQVSPLDNTLVKALNCNPANSIGPCVLAGTVNLNATPFTSGVILTIPLSVAASATGALSISANVLAASSSGALVPITSSSVILTVLSRYDLNGDGAVNSADVTLSLAQVMGTAPCTNADVNGDKSCDVSDVILEILAALGKIH